MRVVEAFAFLAVVCGMAGRDWWKDHRSMRRHARTTQAFQASAASGSSLPPQGSPAAHSPHGGEWGSPGDRHAGAP